MKSSLVSGKVALAVSLAFLIPAAPREALAKGGTFHLWSAWSPAEAATVTSPRTEATSETHSRVIFGSCGGRRIRDPNTHRCRGPADFGN
jgi:hypothetical protein